MPSFPTRRVRRKKQAAPRSVNDAARWIALRATVIVMPVFVLALTNPSLYLAAIMKTVTLGQQAGETTARSAGKELVGSTLMGALVGACVWLGLSLLANLWMLTLWLMAAALWCGSAMFGARRTPYRPSFWSNALITALILLGPAIEDSANGKSVLQASVVRISLFVGVAMYAWATIWALERWRESRSSPQSPQVEPMEESYMIVRNLLVGLPSMLLCMVVQVALAFWGVRYFIRQSETEQLNPAPSSGCARCWW